MKNDGGDTLCDDCSCTRYYCACSDERRAAYRREANAALRSRLVKAHQSENERLRALLSRAQSFVRHTDVCKVGIMQGERCKCGAAALMGEIRKVCPKHPLDALMRDVEEMGVTSVTGG